MIGLMNTKRNNGGKMKTCDYLKNSKQQKCFVCCCTNKRCEETIQKGLCKMGIVQEEKQARPPRPKTNKYY